MNYLLWHSLKLERRSLKKNERRMLFLKHGRFQQNYDRAPQKGLVAHERGVILLKIIFEKSSFKTQQFYFSNCLSFYTQVLLWHCSINRMENFFMEKANTTRTMFFSSTQMNSFFSFIEINKMGLNMVCININKNKGGILTISIPTHK